MKTLRTFVSALVLVPMLVTPALADKRSDARSEVAFGIDPTR